MDLDLGGIYTSLAYMNFELWRVYVIMALKLNSDC